MWARARERKRRRKRGEERGGGDGRGECEEQSEQDGSEQCGGNGTEERSRQEVKVESGSGLIDYVLGMGKRWGARKERGAVDEDELEGEDRRISQGDTSFADILRTKFPLLVR